MIKTALLGLLFLIIATPAYAETRANVNIVNNVNSPSSSDSKTTTDITVKTNGKVTNYKSEEPGSIEVNAVNDEHTIKVNGQIIQVTSKPSNANTSQTPTPTIDEDKDNDNINDELEKSMEFVEEQKSLIQTIEDLFKKVFSVFG